MRGEIEPADAMRRALSENEPSRLRQRIEAMEARAAEAEAEARKAKGDHAKAVLELARAVEDSKDAQRRLKADLQTEIDALREALRLANADNWSNSGGAAMSEATKKALKANLGLRLETIQERHIREMARLAEEAESRLAEEIERKLSEARAEADRAREDAVAERDLYWETELENRLNQARMPALTEPLDDAKEAVLPRTWEIPLIATARSLLPQRRPMLACIGIGAVAAAIWFTAAQMSSKPSSEASTDTARAEPATLVTTRVETETKPVPAAKSEAVRESLPAVETNISVASDEAEREPPPEAEPAEVIAEAPPPVPPHAEPAVPTTETGSPVTETVSATTETVSATIETASPTERNTGSVQQPAEPVAQTGKDTESAAQPTEAEAKTATQAKPVADDKTAARVRSLQRQATLLRERLKIAERRAATARREALAAATALEEAQARIQSVDDPVVPARPAETADPVDLFAPTE